MNYPLIHLTNPNGVSYCLEGDVRSRDRKMANCPACFAQVEKMQTIDQMMADMRHDYEHGRQPLVTSVHPVERLYEVREFNQNVREMARTIKLSGGELRIDPDEQ